MCLFEDIQAASSIIDMLRLPKEVFDCLRIFNMDLRPLYDQIQCYLHFLREAQESEANF